MVIAYHVIMSAYGFWLPNDPRGSWSDNVRKFELQAFGPATKVDTRESVAHIKHDRRLRAAAKEVLEYRPVQFTDDQIQTIGQGMANYIEKSGVTFWAAAIMDDHVHVVYMRHRYKSEIVNNLLKGETTKALIDAGQHPFAKHAKSNEAPPACWGRKWWTVYIDNVEHLLAAIRYVGDNPLKDGRERQKWNWVVPHPKTWQEYRNSKIV